MIRLLSVLLVFSFAASAQAQAKAYVGAVLGMSVPNADDTSARPMFGIIGGARLDGELGIGGFYLASSKDETINSVEVPFDYSLYGMEGSFHLEGVAEGAFLFARVGLAKVESKVAANSVNYSPMVWGLGAGYDYFISENFSVGGEGSFLSVLKDGDPDGDLKSFVMLNFLAAAKFWF